MSVTTASYMTVVRGQESEEVRPVICLAVLRTEPRNSHMRVSSPTELYPQPSRDDLMQASAKMDK